MKTTEKRATESNDPTKELERQQWKMYPENSGERPVSGAVAGQRLAKYGIIKNPADLLELPVGSVVKTGVSAYERIE